MTVGGEGFNAVHDVVLPILEAQELGKVRRGWFAWLIAQFEILSLGAAAFEFAAAYDVKLFALAGVPHARVSRGIAADVVCFARLLRAAVEVVPCRPHRRHGRRCATCLTAAVVLIGGQRSPLGSSWSCCSLCVGGAPCRCCVLPAACVRPCSEMSWFARAGVHDGDNGRVAAVATSIDDNFLLTAGYDGVVCVLVLRLDQLEEEARLAAAKGSDISVDFLFPSALAGAVAAAAPSDVISASSDVDPATGLLYFVPTTVAELQAMVAIDVGKSSVPVDHHDEAKEEAVVPAPDIVDVNAYSIQVSSFVVVAFPQSVERWLARLRCADTDRLLLSVCPFAVTTGREAENRGGQARSNRRNPEGKDAGRNQGVCLCASVSSTVVDVVSSEATGGAVCLWPHSGIGLSPAGIATDVRRDSSRERHGNRPASEVV